MDGAQSKGISDAEATTASQTCDSFQKLACLAEKEAMSALCTPSKIATLNL